MKFRVISLHKKREEKLKEKTAQKLAPQQAAEVCKVLESNKAPIRMRCACIKCIAGQINFQTVSQTLRNYKVKNRIVHNLAQ